MYSRYLLFVCRQCNANKCLVHGVSPTPSTHRAARTAQCRWDVLNRQVWSQSWAVHAVSILCTLWIRLRLCILAQPWHPGATTGTKTVTKSDRGTNTPKFSNINNIISGWDVISAGMWSRHASEIMISGPVLQSCHNPLPATLSNQLW